MDKDVGAKEKKRKLRDHVRRLAGRLHLDCFKAETLAMSNPAAEAQKLASEYQQIQAGMLSPSNLSPVRPMLMSNYAMQNFKQS